MEIDSSVLLTTIAVLVAFCLFTFNKDPAKRLPYAASERKWDEVKGLVTKNNLRDADLDHKESYKNDWTALMTAAYYGKIDLVEMLVERGAALNLKSKTGYTALYIARGNHREIATYLRGKGATERGG